jgi:hypothetical protein
VKIRHIVVVATAVSALVMASALVQAQTSKSASGGATKVAHAPKSAIAKRKSTSLHARTAACRKDCSAGSLHGTYRAYGANDPHLKSPEGRKLYAECVRLCLDPLPGFYVQKPIVESGGSWFGMTKSDCLGCHAAGKPKRFWPGVNTLPSDLKR